MGYEVLAAVEKCCVAVFLKRWRKDTTFFEIRNKKVEN